MGIFIITVILAVVDSTSWPSAFFFATMASVVVLNAAAGVFQNSTYGVAAPLPMSFTNAIIVGMNLSGTVSSLAAILTLAVASDPRTAAIYYFSSALAFLVLLLAVYGLLYRNVSVS